MPGACRRRRHGGGGLGGLIPPQLNVLCVDVCGCGRGPGAIYAGVHTGGLQASTRHWHCTVRACGRQRLVISVRAVLSPAQPEVRAYWTTWTNVVAETA